MNLESFCSKIKLTGTEPQIKWATTIRKKKVEDFKKLSIRHMALAIKPMVSEDDLKAMGCKTQLHLIGLLYAIAKYVISCPNATWWITHRDETILNWMPNAAKICVEHFSKTKPFK
jgi:hypothetical protein